MFDNSDDYEILQKYIPLKNLPAFGLFRLDKSKKAEEFISSYVDIVEYLEPVAEGDLPRMASRKHRDHPIS